jgi:hypothetical protein
MLEVLRTVVISLFILFLLHQIALFFQKHQHCKTKTSSANDKYKLLYEKLLEERGGIGNPTTIPVQERENTNMFNTNTTTNLDSETQELVQVLLQTEMPFGSSMEEDLSQIILESSS